MEKQGGRQIARLTVKTRQQRKWPSCDRSAKYPRVCYNHLQFAATRRHMDVTCVNNFPHRANLAEKNSEKLKYHVIMIMIMMGHVIFR